MRIATIATVLLGLVSLSYAQATPAKPAPKPTAAKPAPTAEELAKKAAAEAKKLESSIPKVEEALGQVKPQAKPAQARKLLVFTLCKGFRHSSIPLAAKTFELMGKKTGAFEVVVSDDPAMFAAEKLKEFDAIMMDNNTGALFADETLKKNLLDFVKNGKGLAGIHASCDTGAWKFPEFSEMIGGIFAGHPFRKITVKNEDPSSPVNSAFGGKDFDISDEIYTFKEPYSRDRLHILLSIDASKTDVSKGSRADKDYALSWIQECGKGRVFYCAFGHDDAIFWNPQILQHYLDGIQYALGDLKAAATPSGKKTSALSADVKGLGGDDKVAAAPAMPTYKVGEWSDLFNGKDFTGWICRDYKKKANVSPDGPWKIADGVLSSQKPSTDIWTAGRFGDFELELEFKHEVDAPGAKPNSGNSGVFLRTDKLDSWLHTGFEIQVIKSYDAKTPGKHDCGALYDCLAPSKNTLTKVGEWQKYHITFKGNLLTIELNGTKILEANLDDWKEAHKNPDGSPNKFNIAYKDMAKDGHIGLQFHGDPISYRNIKIKPLTEPKAAN